MRVDAYAGTCDTRDCRGVMDEAVGRGRRDAAALRVPLGAFRRCGHEVIAVDPQTGAPWIAVSPTNATVTGLQKFAAAVHRAVKDRLRAAHPRVQVSDYEWIWRLEPGTVDRLTGYVLYCEEPDGDKECLGDRAVLATTDHHGGLLGELREIGEVREGPGPLELPPM
ncbi:hypothetical protein [Streptomyces sp. NPDC001665]